jgi:predicted negative regulator of RcsB-dependent stress response
MGKTDFAELMKAQAQLMETSNNSFIDKLGLLMASSDTMDKKSARRAELAQLNDLIKNEPEHNIKELHKSRKAEVVSLLYGA